MDKFVQVTLASGEAAAIDPQFVTAMRTTSQDEYASIYRGSTGHKALPGMLIKVFTVDGARFTIAAGNSTWADVVASFSKEKK
jgi:hypothetical protein